MNKTTTPEAVLGTSCRVDICEGTSGVLLSVGPVSVRLDLGQAEDVAATLARALLACIEAAPVTYARNMLALDGGADRDEEWGEWDVPTLPENFGSGRN